MTPAVKWACPKCGAEPNEHGRGECDRGGQTCAGFLCECDGYGDISPTHGESLAEPCGHARCDHCGWSGTFPRPPGKLPSWAKAALAAGWTAPDGWTP